MDPCGSEENTRFLPEYEDVNQFMQSTLKAIVQATKASNEMPSSGDDFDYYSSFPGFQDAMDVEGRRVLHMIQSILKQQNVKINMGSTSGATDIEDKLDLLMDANDQILERVGTWLDEAAGIKKNDSSLVIAQATMKQSIASWNKKSPVAANKSAASFRLLSARNIQRPQLKFKDKVDNRNTPFVPSLRNKFNARQSLEDSLRLPEGADTEDPAFEYPHPYKYEIENLEYSSEDLSESEPMTLRGIEDHPLIFIDKHEQLTELMEDLKKQTHIAVDLEHHSYRTFQGITCLLQISTRSCDYLVDTLELRSELHVINEVFTDPKIVKVFHGADSDIDWLQRDLGLYVVNMFDTGQAARVMGASRFSLAHLLNHYCDVTADKKYQLADWRIRPLPEELQKYAREDTHYLLYIYDRMKNELIERGNENKNLLMSVLQRSNEVCLKVYKKPFFSQDHYMDLYKKNKKVFNSRQLQALKEMYTWRDETARMEDESYGYVLPNHMMFQICDILPRERQGILSCCNPIPPLVRQYLNEIYAIVMKAREAPLEKSQVGNIPRPLPLQPRKKLLDMDSKLNCPHDLTDNPTDKKKKMSTLLDGSGKPKSQPPCKLTLQKKPILALFDTAVRVQAVKSKVQETVDTIKASFMDPYCQFLAEEDNKSPKKPSKFVKLKPSSTPSSPQKPWKLLPNSVKRKEAPSSGETGPAAKRAKTAEDDKPIMTEDDTKAIPFDIEPIRFQKQSEKKKKNRNRDVDMMDSIQKHLSNIRKLQEQNSTVLGQEPTDADSYDNPWSKDKCVQDKTDSSDKPVTITIDIGNSDDNVKNTDNLKSKNGGKKKKKDRKNKDKDGSSDLKTDKNKSVDDVEVIDVDLDESNGDTEFKPYNYDSAAQQLLQGKSKSKLNYFDPQSQMRKGKGPKVSKNKGHSKQGKSLTWKR